MFKFSVEIIIKAKTRNRKKSRSFSFLRVSFLFFAMFNLSVQKKYFSFEKKRIKFTDLKYLLLDQFVFF